MNYHELLAICDELPKYKSESEYQDKSSFDENDECCICLEKDKLWKSMCNHIICKNCIPQMKSTNCPICRKNIKNELNEPVNKEKIEGFSFSDRFSGRFSGRLFSLNYGRANPNSNY